MSYTLEDAAVAYAIRKLQESARKKYGKYAEKGHPPFQEDVQVGCRLAFMKNDIISFM